MKSKDRENKVQDLGNALKNMFSEFSLEKKFGETELVQSWEQLVGPSISSRTGKLYVKNSVLYVEVLSAPLKNELTLSKSALLKRVEDTFGKAVIKDIKLL